MATTTRMTATNTFTKGLVMDFNPTVTKNDVLTNALNATLLTFNGNEMQLQQDMGNGRVETAFLPEGYVPVGTCEYGDIIYIVSYNPLDNKCQIGCFPSPERNISSEEINSLKQALDANEFQVLDGGNPTGKLNAVSIKKVVYGNNNMNPGDKFIIYESATDSSGILAGNPKKFSDYNNLSHTHNTWPKLVKLNVVSIEDSGKITSLNTAVKWYNNDYYIQSESNVAVTDKPDIDSYRTLVSSAYSVFQSKVSGKLAILAELERIDEFGCTYVVYTRPETKEDGTITNKYDIYFYTSWSSSHNDINPSGIIITDSKWNAGMSDYSGRLGIPVYNEETNSVQYDYLKEESLELPLKSAATENGFDGGQVYRFYLQYNLGSASDSFENYINEDSYNAKIANIIDWKKTPADVATPYHALANSNDYDNVGTVYKVTAALDLKSSEPECDVFSDSPLTGLYGRQTYYYLYNLLRYETVEEPTDDEEKNIKINYYTKGRNGEEVGIRLIDLTADVINNYFHKDVPTLVANTTCFEFPKNTKVSISDTDTQILDNDLSNLVWQYTVAPVMPYGVLDYLAVTGTIDFSKINSGLIDLTTWRYYNSGNIATLTWGLEAYPETNKGIAEVVFDFYDNQGIAASYHVAGKTSYSGTFTEQIILNQQNSSYKLNDIDSQGNTIIHAGEESSEGTVYLTQGNKAVSSVEEAGEVGLYPDNDNPNIYLNDAGTLYSNILYLVKITVKYCPIDLVGEFNTDITTEFKTFYRWFWSNGMFNDSYYNIQDFIVLQPTLSLDFSAEFNTKATEYTNALTPQQIFYYNQGLLDASEDSENYYKTVGANVYFINQNCEDDISGNMLFKINPGLSENFNTFYLASDKALSELASTVSMGESSITKNIESPALQYTEETIVRDCDDAIQPIVAKYLQSLDSDCYDRSGYIAYNYGVNNCVVSNAFLELLSTERKAYNSENFPVVTPKTGDENIELYDSVEAYIAYPDSFSLNLVGEKVEEIEGTLTYYDSNGNEKTMNSEYYQCLETTLESLTTGIPLTLTGIAFSKLFASELTKDNESQLLKSIIHNQDSLKSVGLHMCNGHLYFNDVTTLYMGDGHGHRTRWGMGHSYDSDTTYWLRTGFTYKAGDEHQTVNFAFTHDEMQALFKQNRQKPLTAFVITKNPSGVSHPGSYHSTYSDVSWVSIKDAFGIDTTDDGNVYHIHKESNQIPSGEPSGWGSDNNQVLLYGFTVFDEDQNYVVPIADYFIGDTSGNQSRRTNGAITQTLADMLGALLAQLYVVDSTDENKPLLYTNTTYLQDYIEYWNKDIVINIEGINTNVGEEEYKFNTDIWNILTIQTQVMSVYLDCLKNNSGIEEFDEISQTNIEFILYGINRTIEFQYQVPYDLGNLLYEYTEKQNSVNRILLTPVDNINDQQKTAAFYGNVTENTLYTWTDSTVIKLGSSSVMYFPISFAYDDNEELKMARYTTPGYRIDSSALGNIAKVIQYNDGNLTFHDLTAYSGWYSTYYIKFQSDDNNPSIEELPRISFFNKYTPGK